MSVTKKLEARSGANTLFASIRIYFGANAALLAEKYAVQRIESMKIWP